jgi:urease accessory protein UreF
MERTCEFGCDAEHCPTNGGYYVTAIDGDRWFKMAGPYQTHAEALAHVEEALRIADEHDGRAWFMSWGTCHVKNEGKLFPLGKLQEVGLMDAH